MVTVTVEILLWDGSQEERVLTSLINDPRVAEVKVMSR